jgi:hypothetical protein
MKPITQSIADGDVDSLGFKIFTAAVGRYVARMNKGGFIVDVQKISEAFRCPEQSVHLAINAHNSLIERDGVIIARHGKTT